MKLLNLLGSSSEHIDLIGRRTLIPLREKLFEEISNAPKGTIFSMDLEQVEAINGSGVDEVIIKPIKWMQENFKADDKYLYLFNLSEEFDHAYNINTTFLTEQSCVMAKKDDGFQLLGDLGHALREVVQSVYQKKQVTARELGDELGKKLNLASTQLNKLFEARLIKRVEEQLEEGGRQYIYSSLF